MKEIVVIGGGINGLWSALHLNEAGLDVTIADKGDFSDNCSFGNAGFVVPSHFVPLASPGMIAKGMSWMFRRSSPFYIRPRLSLELAQWLWLFYRSASRRHVEESAALLRDLQTESREMYRELQDRPGFDFRFEQKGIVNLFRSAGAERSEIGTAEAAHALGIEAEHLQPGQLALLDPGIRMDVRGGIYYPGDAHMYPPLLMRQMKTHLTAKGVSFLADHEAIRLQDNGSNGCVIHFRKGDPVTCRNAVVASGSWSGKLMKASGMRLPMQDGKGYSITIAGAPLRPSIPSILHEARVAVTPMGDFLRVAGTLEISGMDGIIKDDRVRSILDAVGTYYPDLRIERTAPVWYGYRPFIPDGLPCIGRWKEGSSVILATGHAMLGLSLAPATGRLVRDVVVNGVRVNRKIEAGRFL